MTKPTKQQLQEESLEKKFGIPAVVLTLMTIVFNFLMSTSSLEGRELGRVLGILSFFAAFSSVFNIIAAIKVKFGFFRWILIISTVVCVPIAGWAWFGKVMLAP